MKKHYLPIIYDLSAVFFTSILFFNFLDFKILTQVSLINLLIIIIFIFTKFYKSSNKINVFSKIKVVLFSYLSIILLKIFYFGSSFYTDYLFYNDINLLILLILPRFFLNIKEFKINLIHKYNNSKKNTLVIGGLGYIGSHLVANLLKEGNNVSVLDCCMYGDRTLKHFSKFKNFNFIEGYASDVIKLSKLMKDSSEVVHLAGLVGDPACALSESDTKYFNIKTTNIIRDLCHEYEVQKLIFASSCSVYGNNTDICFENTKPNPVSLYAATKRDSEIELMESKIDTKILRFSTIFGPSERLRFDLVVNLFIAQAYFDKNITVFGGDQKRPFLHVADAANSIKNFLNYKNTNSQDIYNIGFDELNFTIGDIAKLVSKNIPNSNISYMNENNDNRNYHVSFKRYNSTFNNLSRFSIVDSINQYIELFNKENINYKSDIYSNLMTTKNFLDKSKSELRYINNFE